MRDLPDLGTFALVTVPFRAFLHLRDDGERLAVLRALHDRLRPGGTLAFDVFHPDRIDIAETHGRWIEREPGIDERALLGRGRTAPAAVGADRRRRGADGALVGRSGRLARPAGAGRLRADQRPRLVRRAAARARRHRLRVVGASAGAAIGSGDGALSRHVLGGLPRPPARPPHERAAHLLGDPDRDHSRRPRPRDGRREPAQRPDRRRRRHGRRPCRAHAALPAEVPALVVRLEPRAVALLQPRRGLRAAHGRHLSVDRRASVRAPRVPGGRRPGAQPMAAAGEVAARDPALHRAVLPRRSRRSSS